jgi:hypothetical protein
MARLQCKDSEYGIPVATRIPEEIAYRFNEEAEQEGKTLSRYIAEFIERAKYNEQRLKELEARIVGGNKAVRRFILELSEGNSEQINQYIEIYNSILKNEKSK